MTDAPAGGALRARAGTVGVKEKCVVCKNAVFESQKLYVENTLYHVACFRCSRCQVTLQAGKFKTGDDGQVYCDKHLDAGPTIRVRAKSVAVPKSASAPAAAEAPVVTNADLAKCPGCGDAVYETQALNARGILFHHACFKCNKCWEPLLEASFQIAPNGRCYCEPHFKELSSVETMDINTVGAKFSNQTAEEKAAADERKRALVEAAARNRAEREAAPKATAASGVGAFGAKRMKCDACGKSVYEKEKMEVVDFRNGVNLRRVFHRTCFICARCKKTLKTDDFEVAADEGTCYCKRHYAMRTPGTGTPTGASTPTAALDGSTADTPTGANGDTPRRDDSALSLPGGESSSPSGAPVTPTRDPTAPTPFNTPAPGSEAAAAETAAPARPPRVAEMDEKAAREQARREAIKAKREADAAAAKAAEEAAAAEAKAKLQRAKELARQKAEARDNPAASGSAPALPSRGDKCAGCGKTVYAREKLDVPREGKIFHKTCFTCTKCKKILTLKEYDATPVEKVFFCPLHFRQWQRGAINLDGSSTGLVTESVSSPVLATGSSMDSPTAPRNNSDADTPTSATTPTAFTTSTQPVAPVSALDDKAPTMNELRSKRASTLKDRASMYMQSAQTVDKKHEQKAHALVESRKVEGQAEAPHLQDVTASLQEAYVVQDRRHEVAAAQAVAERDTHSGDTQMVKTMGVDLGLDAKFARRRTVGAVADLVAPPTVQSLVRENKGEPGSADEERAKKDAEALAYLQSIGAAPPGMSVDTSAPPTRSAAGDLATPRGDAGPSEPLGPLKSATASRPRGPAGRRATTRSRQARSMYIANDVSDNAAADMLLKMVSEDVGEGAEGAGEAPAQQGDAEEGVTPSVGADTPSAATEPATPVSTTGDATPAAAPATTTSSSSSAPALTSTVATTTTPAVIDDDDDKEDSGIAISVTSETVQS